MVLWMINIYEKANPSKKGNHMLRNMKMKTQSIGSASAHLNWQLPNETPIIQGRSSHMSDGKQGQSTLKFSFPYKTFGCYLAGGVYNSMMLNSGKRSQDPFQSLQSSNQKKLN